MTKDSEPRLEPGDLALARRFLGYVRPHAGPLLVALLLLFVSGALELAGPWLTKIAIDDAIGGSDEKLLTKVVIAFLGVLVLAFAAIGFGLFTTGVLANLFMEEEYGTKTFERGVLGTIGGLGLLLVLPFAGRYYDGLYRRDPSKALRLVGWLILPAALITPIEYFMPNAILFVILGIPRTIMLFTAFTMVGPVITTIVPYPPVRASSRMVSAILRSWPNLSVTRSMGKPVCPRPCKAFSKIGYSMVPSSGTRNGRCASGRLTRSASTAAHTTTKAKRVPMLVISPTT